MPENTWEDERDHLEAEVNRWHAETVRLRSEIERWETLAREKTWGYVHDGRADRMRGALQQIAWMADATDPSSVKAAQIAREALGEGPAAPLCGYCGDRPSSLVPCPECDS